MKDFKNTHRSRLIFWNFQTTSGDLQVAAYLVTWDLNKERSNYDAARRMLIALIQQYDYTLNPGLESVRFISTNQTANQVYDQLKSALDGNDRIIISKMNRKEYWGQLNPTVWSWIDARL